MNNTEKFTGKAAIYAQARPGYPSALLDWFWAEADLPVHPVITDIGSGTGIFTRALLQHGAAVYAVEPNDDMRNTAEQAMAAHTHVHSVSGSAERTTLCEHSVDAVTAAQAFHWFDLQAFQSECRRILRPGGSVLLVWNHRVESAEVIQQNAAICRKYCPNFRGFSGGNDHIEHDIELFYEGSYRKKIFEYSLQYNRAQFLNRMASASYGLCADDPQYPAFCSALSALFDAYQRDGILTIPNETTGYLGRL